MQVSIGRICKNIRNRSRMIPMNKLSPRLLGWKFVVLKIFVASLLLFPQVIFAINRAMVVSEHEIASGIGIDILKKGGNAIDAAVAIGYALAVVQPCCGNLGGGGFMLLHLANGKNIFLNFREKAPLAATPDMFNDKPLDASTQGFLAVATPGTVLGLEVALRQYGSMPRDTVLNPAIKLAENGFELKESDIAILSKFTEFFKKDPGVANIFMKSKDNKLVPYQTGDRLIQKDLANSLKIILKQGSRGFYQGSIAETIVKASQSHGGILSLDDFRKYKENKIESLTPITCRYREYEIITAPPPSAGGIALCEMLNLLEPYPLSKWGYHTQESVIPIVEAMRQAFIDREQLGDPHYNTTHYAVLDQAGNWVLVTYTLNSLFGAKVIAGNTGFFLNNEMDDFTTRLWKANQFGLRQGTVNKIEPGKIPLSSMSPTLVLKDRHPFLALGAAGGPKIITANLHTFLNIVDYGMDIDSAVNSPRFHFQNTPDIIMAEKKVFSATTAHFLKKKGYKIKIVDDLGIEEAIWINPSNHSIEGASDRRRAGGLAIGY